MEKTFEKVVGIWKLNSFICIEANMYWKKHFLKSNKEKHHENKLSLLTLLHPLTFRVDRTMVNERKMAVLLPRWMFTSEWNISSIIFAELWMLFILMCNQKWAVLIWIFRQMKVIAIRSVCCHDVDSDSDTLLWTTSTETYSQELNSSSEWITSQKASIFAWVFTLVTCNSLKIVDIKSFYRFTCFILAIYSNSVKNKRKSICDPCGIFWSYWFTVSTKGNSHEFRWLLVCELRFNCCVVDWINSRCSHYYGWWWKLKCFVFRILYNAVVYGKVVPNEYSRSTEMHNKY